MMAFLLSDPGSLGPSRNSRPGLAAEPLPVRYLLPSRAKTCRVRHAPPQHAEAGTPDRPLIGQCNERNTQNRANLGIYPGVFQSQGPTGRPEAELSHERRNTHPLDLWHRGLVGEDTGKTPVPQRASAPASAPGPVIRSIPSGSRSAVTPPPLITHQSSITHNSLTIT